METDRQTDRNTDRLIGDFLPCACICSTGKAMPLCLRVCLSLSLPVSLSVDKRCFKQDDVAKAFIDILHKKTVNMMQVKVVLFTDISATFYH